MDESKISCDRCREIVEHAKKLLQIVPTINEDDIIGICDHCKWTAHICDECKELIKFFASKMENKERAKERVQAWLSKVKFLLKDAKEIKEDLKTEKQNQDTGSIRTRSELRFDRICRGKSDRVRREVEIVDLFHAGPTRVGSAKTSFAIDGENKQDGIKSFQSTIDRFGKMRFTSEEKITPSIFYDDKESSIYPVDSLTKFEKDEIKIKKHAALSKIPLAPIPSEEELTASMLDIFIKDSNKTRHEITKRVTSDEAIIYYKQFYKSDSQQAMQTKALKRRNYYGEDILSADYSAQQIYDKDRDFKHVCLTFEEPENERDLRLDRKIPNEKYNTDRERYIERGQKDVFNDLLIEPVPEFIKDYQERMHQKKVDHPSSLNKHYSENALFRKMKSDELESNFSFSFPHEIIPKKTLKHQKTSFELIRETQNMIIAKHEEEKQRLEEERKKKAEEDEKPRSAREQKQRIATEKKLMKDIERQHRKELQPIDKQEAHTTKEGEDKSETDSEYEILTSAQGTTTKIMKSGIDYLGNEPKKFKPLKISPDSVQELSQESIELKDTKGTKPLNKREKDAEKTLKEYEKKEKKGETKKDKEEEFKKDKDIKQKKEEDMLREKILKAQRLELKERQKEERLSEKKRQNEEKRHREEHKAKEEKQVKPQGPDPSEVNRRLKDQAANKLKHVLDEAETVIEPPPPIPRRQEIPTGFELNVNQIKVKNRSMDDLILQLVKIKPPPGKSRDKSKPKRLSQIITPLEIEHHKGHHGKDSDCPLCMNSDLELELDIRNQQTEEVSDIIKGEKICKIKPITEVVEDEGVVPHLFQRKFDTFPVNTVCEAKEAAEDNNELRSHSVGKKNATDMETTKGITRYALSDRTFIENGWTMLPIEKVVRKMNVYRMRPAHPEFNWFERNKNKQSINYDTGELLAEIDENGRGRWFYKNGRVALDYYNAEELNAQQRFVVFSNGTPDERGRSRPYTLLATFDYQGNGVVFDHGGKIRLKYNQTEGVVLDKNIGPESHWKWHALNDPPVLQQVMVDTQMPHKDPDILKMAGPQDDDKSCVDNELMLAIEFDNFIKEKSKKMSQSFKPFQIKMKALKINENFSLKILDQATVYLIFRDGMTNLKLNIGMILDHKEIIDTDTAEVSEVSNSLEKLPARTDSLRELQRSVAYAQHFEKARSERERKWRCPDTCASIDNLKSAISRPIRAPLQAMQPSSSDTTRNCCYKCNRKPSSNNFYYNNRLI